MLFRSRIVGDLRRSNRWLGGVAAARWGIARLLGPADRGRTITLLDVGTGVGDVPAALAQWGDRRGITIVPLGMQRLADAARTAAGAKVHALRADAAAPPFAADTVDLVMMSQTLHHFDDASAIRLLRSIATIARRGVLICDLRPARGAALGYRIAGPVLGLHRVTIADGVTSLARGYTSARLAALCRAAGMNGAVATRRPLARVVAWWRK